MDKREHLVQVAFELFYREGVHAVGINRVLAESGVAKKTLYNHFDSKEALVAATLEYRNGIFLRWMQARMSAAAKGVDALRAMFMALDDWFNQRDIDMPSFYGCYFINLSAEFGDAQHPLHRQCCAHKAAVRDLIYQQLESCVADADVERLADALALLKEGAIVQAQVSGDKAAALKAWAVADQLLVGVTEG